MEITTNAGTMSISEFINRLASELNIEGTKGVVGNELELIALVRNCQHLYNKQVPDFKNIQKKNETWEAISKVFGTSVIEVQSRWKSMRDVFSKTKNKYDCDDARKAVCPYYEDINFLEPYILSRRTIKIAKNSKKDLRLEQINDDNDNDLNFNEAGAMDPSPKSYGSTIKFIETIKDCPTLYHHRCMGTSFRQQKMKGWQKIAKAFEMSVGDCFNKWRNLRERYSRERKSLNNGKPAPTWEFFNHLLFLDEHVKRRRRFARAKMNISDLSEITFEGENSPSVNSTSEDPICVKDVKTIMTNSDQYQNITFMEVTSDLFNNESSTNEIEQDSSTNSSNLPKPDSCSQNKLNLDEDELFGQTIAAEMKQISCPKKKIKLKADIYRLLYQCSCD